MAERSRQEVKEFVLLKSWIIFDSHVSNVFDPVGTEKKKKNFVDHVAIWKCNLTSTGISIISFLMVNYGISITVVLEIPYFTTKPMI